jgi:hypothetical protein
MTDWSPDRLAESFKLLGPGTAIISGMLVGALAQLNNPVK